MLVWKKLNLYPRWREGGGWVIKSLRISIEGRRGKLKVEGVKKGILVQLNSDGQTKGGGSTSKCFQLGITEKFYKTIGRKCCVTV